MRSRWPPPALHVCQEKRAAYSLRVVIFHPMYKCKTFPYPITSRHPDKVMPAAREFIRQWESECQGSRPYVIIKCFGTPAKLFISPGFRHIRKGRHILDVARRFRFLPCVRELLAESDEEPVPTKDGNFILEGKAPTKERFRVVIGLGEIEDEHQTYKLVTFYPVTE